MSLNEKSIINSIVSALSEDETLSEKIIKFSAAQSAEIPFLFAWRFPAIAVVPDTVSYKPSEMPNVYAAEMTVSVLVYVDIQIPSEENAGFLGDTAENYKGCLELSAEIEDVLDNNTLNSQSILFCHKLSRNSVRRAVSDNGRNVLFRELKFKYLIEETGE